jgi:transcriptional regulator with XRE-family HTH domain
VYKQHDTGGNVRGKRPVQGGALVALRIAKRLTQEQAARAIGVDRTQLSRYENGRVIPSLSSFRRMREAYGVTSEQLEAAITADFLRARRVAARQRRPKGAAA